MADDLVLEMQGIRKEFPGVVANDDVSFDVRRGEVHALLGENGAGKSTLMNILYGLYRPDAGEIRLNGKPVSFSSARDAIAPSSCPVPAASRASSSWLLNPPAPGAPNSPTGTALPAMM